MPFTKTLIVALLIGCVLQSCKEKNNNKIAETVKPLKAMGGDVAFNFSEKEKSLFQPGNVPVALNLDTVSAISQLIDFTKTIPYEKTVARAFTYPDGSSPPKIFYALFKKGRSHSWVPDRRKILLIDIPGTNTIIGYSGGYVENNPDPDNMDSVVAVFLERAFAIDVNDNKNKRSYTEPAIYLVYYHDDCSGAERFYAAIARGYILFQRRNSKFLFSKPIDSLDNKQLRQLSTAAPLIMSISMRKVNHLHP